MGRLGVALVLVGCGDPPADGGGSGLEEPLTEVELRAGCTASSAADWEYVGPGVASLPVGWIEAQQWDDLGWRVHRRYDSEDDLQDATEDWVRREDGQYDQWTVDLGDDGEVDLTEVYTFGDDDLADTRELDLDGDGVPDERSDYVNADGVRVEERLDVLADGTVETLYAYTWDERGRQVALTADDRLDGRLDLVARFTWLGETELLAAYDEDEGNDGLIEYEEAHEYDAARRLVRSFWSDRTLQQELAYSYEGGDPGADAGVWTTWSGGQIVQYVQLTIDRDEEGREIGVRYDYAPSEDAPVDFVLTVTTEWECG